MCECDKFCRARKQIMQNTGVKYTRRRIKIQRRSFKCTSGHTASKKEEKKKTRVCVGYTYIKLSSEHRKKKEGKDKNKTWPVAFSSFLARFPDIVEALMFRFRARVSAAYTCDAKFRNRTRQWPFKFPSLRFPRLPLRTQAYASLLLRNKQRHV